jgi:hypothetical protein
VVPNELYAICGNGRKLYVEQFKAVAIDSRFSFFIWMVAFIALLCSIFDVLGEGVSRHLKGDSKVFVAFYYFQFLSPAGEQVCVVRVPLFLNFITFVLSLFMARPFS